MRCIVTHYIIIVVAVMASAEQRLDRNLPRFEVASVLHNTSGTNSGYSQSTPARFSVTNAKLESLILQAYSIDANIARFLVAGGLTDPRANCTKGCLGKEEILSARFDINATVPKDAPLEQRLLMLRSLLIERFKLRAHLEMRDIPAYALTVAREGRLGPQLRPSSQSCSEWSRARAVDSPDAQVPEPVDSRGRPSCTVGPFARPSEGKVLRGIGEVSSLARAIAGDLDLPIVDRTGLAGNFEFELVYEWPGVRQLVKDFDPGAPTLDIALREQLGLGLVRQTARFEVLVIESVEMPTPN
jgi:uncharacterized protein (TIGR03435 family)